MHLALTPEQAAFQLEIRSYFARLIEEVTAGDGPGAGTHYKEYIRRMGQDGWLGIGWPPEYGGQGRALEEQLIFVEESHRAGVALPILTLNSVGPTIMRMGTDEQKARFLPGILKGEVHFAIGYTEPTAGTDLAALRTRAVRDGDEYVIDGQKIYTSAIQYADYVWLAVRTDPEAPKHKGLSVLIVPTDAPGFSWTPLHTMGGEPTSTTFYEGVRVPVENLVGEENAGWRLITNQLNHERLAITPAGGLMRQLDDVRAWAATTTMADGRRVIDQEWVQLNLARVKAKVEALRLFNWRVATAVGGAVGPADASATKVYGTELNIEAHRLLLEVMGEAGYLAAGSPGAVLAGRIERAYRSTIILTFGGGANEVQRDIVAMVGLGMPRAAPVSALGLALGGGGVVGVAWEVGVVAGLADALGWDPAGVRVLVGTSAGSLVGTQLLQGRTVDELVAGQRGATAGEVPMPAELDLAALGEIFGTWTACDEVTPEVARTIGERAVTAGTVAEEVFLASLGSMLVGPEWPAGDLRVTGVSVDTGERAVWTSADGVPLERAVAASCSVPGMFPPVQVGGGRFVDGGVWSGSNADALLGTGVEAAVFVGPLVSEVGLGRVCGLALERERTLADAGIPLLDVVPGERFAAFGQDLMNAAHCVAALDAGRADGEDAAPRLKDVLS